LDFGNMSAQRNSEVRNDANFKLDTKPTTAPIC